jgi:hypothetical protein
MRKLILSASAISTYKACPYRYKNAYVLGIRPVEDSESQRIGTNWHELLEISSLEPGSVCECDHTVSTIHEEGRSGYIITPRCAICEGTGRVPDNIMDAVVRVLNKRYENVPPGKEEAMALERTRLLYSLIGYRWYYQDIAEPVVMREKKFRLPLLNPDTGHPVPNVFIDGKIDKIINPHRWLAVKEHKSTSKPIDNDSSYWSHLNLDTQTGIYVYATRRLQLMGELEEYGIKASDDLISNISYDVYKKPKTSPKKLTQTDSKKFVENGQYCGQEFEVMQQCANITDGEIMINGENAEIEPGKKEGTFAIRETMEMYGARLLQDITQRPQDFFNCRDFGRTDKEIKALEYELYDIAKDIMSKIRADRWYHNEQQCEATFKCNYCDSCYNGIKLDPDNPPAGMHCIFNRKEE